MNRYLYVIPLLAGLFAVQHTPCFAGNYTVSYSGGIAVSGGSSFPYGSQAYGYGGSGNSSGFVATASATGTITATFTWVPSYANEPIPESVIIMETSTAGYDRYGYSSGTFSANDGLGDSPVASSNGSVQSSGTRWSVNNSPGQSFTVTCSPNASAYMPYGYVSASVTYAASAVIPQVGVGGATVYNNSNNIIIGQGCAPSVSSLNGISFTNYQWAVTGDLFTSYNASVNSATVSYPDATTWASTTPHYFYKSESVSGPDSIRAYVDVHVTINNADVNIGRICARNFVSAIIPDYRFHGIPSVVQFGYIQSGILGFFTGDSTHDGIRWYGAITPNQTIFPWCVNKRGSWEIVQTLVPSIKVVNAGKALQLDKNGMLGLDTQYPYATSEPGTNVTFTDDSAFHYSNDNPAWPVSDDLTSLILSETFKTYMLYKPADIGFGSDFVPLGEVDWNWAVTAVKPNTGWATFAPIPTVVGSIDSLDLKASGHPTWTFPWIFANIMWVPSNP